MKAREGEVETKKKEWPREGEYYQENSAVLSGRGQRKEVSQQGSWQEKTSGFAPILKTKNILVHWLVRERGTPPPGKKKTAGPRGTKRNTRVFMLRKIRPASVLQEEEDAVN